MTRVYKRSAKAGWICVGFAAALLALGFIPYLPIGDPSLPRPPVRLPPFSWGLVGVIAGVALIVLGGVIIIRTARHTITVDEEGITDRSASVGGRVPWRVIDNVELGTFGQTYQLVLTIAGPPQAKMIVNVDDLPDSPSAVFGEVFDAWRAATGRTQRPFRDA